MGKLKALFAVVLLFCGFSAHAVTYIKSIRYEGNETTQASVFNREIYIKPGDILDQELLEKSRQAIMDLGLYKSVKYYLREDYGEVGNSGNDAQVEVVFIVKEKYYFYVLPRAKLVDNEIFLGIQARWDNVAGLNHSMRLRFEDRGSLAGIDKKRNTFTYAYRNVYDSPYTIDLRLQQSNSVDESEGLINRQDEMLRVSLSRWLNERGRNKGWFLGGSLQLQQRFNEVISGDLQSSNVDAVVLGLNGGFQNVNEYTYNRGGKSFGYILDWSDKSIGSESEYTRYQLYYRSYYRFKKLNASNLNVQTKFGHSTDRILGAYAFSLGSNSDLRGYENGRFFGNTMLLINMEYMFPHPHHPSVRYVYFMDIGNTYEHVSDMIHEPLNVGAGFGLRWKIRSLVKIDLRADFGYGFSDQGYKFIFGSKHAF